MAHASNKDVQRLMDQVEPKRLAKILGVCKATLNSWARNGPVPGTEGDTLIRVLIKHPEILAELEQRQTA